MQHFSSNVNRRLTLDMLLPLPNKEIDFRISKYSEGFASKNIIIILELENALLIPLCDSHIFISKCDRKETRYFEQY